MGPAANSRPVALSTKETISPRALNAARTCAFSRTAPSSVRAARAAGPGALTVQG